MLDVHPPHHAANSWRDFFIHIATIVVGLLIAVGIEQTVEYFHHNHQRLELLESLEADTAVCEEDGRNMAEQDKAIADWLLDREKRINDSLWGEHPPVDLPDPPIVKTVEVLSDTHFQAGKASGLLQLLSTDDMDAFSEVDLDVQLSSDQRSIMSQAVRKRKAFEAAFLDRDFKHLNLTKASPADLREYLRLLEDEQTARANERFSADVTAGAAKAVLNGERGIRKLQLAEIEAIRRDLDTGKIPPPSLQAAPH